MTASPTRRDFGVDLLRAGSVLLVVLSHYGLMGALPIGGYHAVVLFFAVSGFCMAMTVPGRTFWQFWLARWRRLIPAFLVCVLLTFCFEGLLNWVRPERSQALYDLGATLICLPTFDVPCEVAYGVGRVLNRYVEYAFVDGALWSLLVEFRFYLVFSVSYILLGQRFAILRQVAWAPMLLLSLVALNQPNFGQGRVADFFQYLPFFAFGIAAYQQSQAFRLSVVGMVLSLGALLLFGLVGIKALSIPFDLYNSAIYIAEMVLFWTVTKLVQKPFGGPGLVRSVLTLAAISYPLYLLHQDIGLIMIGLLTPLFGAVLSGLLAAFVGVVLAFAIYKFIERPTWGLSSSRRPQPT